MLRLHWGAGRLSAVLVSCVAFLLGSFPSGLVLVRIVTGRDIRKYGSGNIGAANVTRTAGLKVGAAAAILDVLKGVLAVLLGRWLDLTGVALAAVAATAVVGHDFSIFLRFRGGKGVATTLGTCAALAPVAALLAFAVWVLVLVATRYASLASLLALAVLPLSMALTGQQPWYVMLGVGLFFLAAIKHRENIVRLRQGRELKIFQRRPPDVS